MVFLALYQHSNLVKTSSGPVAVGPDLLSKGHGVHTIILNLTMTSCGLKSHADGIYQAQLMKADPGFYPWISGLLIEKTAAWYIQEE